MPRLYGDICHGVYSCTVTEGRLRYASLDVDNYVQFGGSPCDRDLYVSPRTINRLVYVIHCQRCNMLESVLVVIVMMDEDDDSELRWSQRSDVTLGPQYIYIDMLLMYIL